VSGSRLSCRISVALLLCCVAGRAELLLPVPDKLVVLTFDDSVASHYTVVRPILKRHGFGATFFITEGFSFRTNKQDYMTWEQISELHRDGFEIGNHTRDHISVSARTLGQLREQLEAINTRCAEHSIPRPTSFGYPGNAIVPAALPILKELGIRFARRGGAPEHPYEWGRGFAYEPALDHPLLIPSAGDARPDWTIEDFKRATDQARGGRIAVLQFHGVPDREHPWVHTPPERFEQFMAYLHTNAFKVIALRDLARYVDAEKTPPNPVAVIEERKANRKEVLVEGAVVDAITGGPLPARLYIQGADGAWHFPRAASASGTAVRYERRNWINANAVEMHTTLSAHPFRIELLPGKYTFTVERGKEYFPETREVTVESGMPKVELRLRRWVNMAGLGWFSGDTHNHREASELSNVMLAEDVNVGLPLMDWTRDSAKSPVVDRGTGASVTNGLRHIDNTHVWHARNTEYEIFRTSGRNHTLGAFFVLNHQTRFQETIFPLRRIADKARAEGALIDLDKHNWPWSLAIIPLLKVDLFELANNHHWRTDYSITNWADAAPAWMKLSGGGTDTERDWTLYGFQTYYALLNCGFRLRPSGGSASGVHPVPFGFGRVYVHLDHPFSYNSWIKGLDAGRSFVTTGPIMFAKAEGRWPGAEFDVTNSAAQYTLECSVQSEQPLESIELIVNGGVTEHLQVTNRKTDSGAYLNEVSTRFQPGTTSWLAWRCFEKRPGNRLRFAHTAPWYFKLPDKLLVPRREEAEWLVARVKGEIARNQGIAPEELIEEYRDALKAYEQIAARAR
jgi:peptidoglycan/xylan/chitin deacetylase (PgdA/CDA1 family)